MKNIKILLLAGAVFLSSCQAFLTKDKSPVIATYKGGKITKQEAQTEIDKLILKNNQLKGLTLDKLTAQQKELIIKEAVTKEILYKEAKKLRLDKEDDYRQALKIFKTELLQQKIYAHLIKDATDTAKTKELYKKVVKELQNKKELNVRYMALQTQKEAQKFYNRLKRRPKSFAYYAKNKSIDKKTAKNGGDLGFVLEGSFPAPINQALANMTTGQVSKPIALKDNWVLVKLEKKRKAQIPTYIEAKDGLKKTLSIKAIQDFTSEKLKNADIKMTVN